MPVSPKRLDITKRAWKYEVVCVPICVKFDWGSKMLNRLGRFRDGTLVITRESFRGWNHYPFFFKCKKRIPQCAPTTSALRPTQGHRVEARGTRQSIVNWCVRLSLLMSGYATGEEEDEPAVNHITQAEVDSYGNFMLADEQGPAYDEAFDDDVVFRGSPFYKIFRNIYDTVEVSELKAQTGDTNQFYIPGFMEYMLKGYLAYFPLVFQRYFFPEKRPLTNNNCEFFFHMLKKDCFPQAKNKVSFGSFVRRVSQFSKELAFNLDVNNVGPHINRKRIPVNPDNDCVDDVIVLPKTKRKRRQRETHEQGERVEVWRRAGEFRTANKDNCLGYSAELSPSKLAELRAIRDCLLRTSVDADAGVTDEPIDNPIAESDWRNHGTRDDTQVMKTCWYIFVTL